LSSPEGTVFLYLTRQHKRKTVPEGEDNNTLNTEGEKSEPWLAAFWRGKGNIIESLVS
jgi:hypothetical protein